MQFVKMHGAGNDYVYVDCFHEPVPKNPEELAVQVSDRHTGIGADGLILIVPSTQAAARMRMWNADGTEAEMCGNGIRCVARYLFESGIVGARDMTIETGRGVLRVRLHISQGRVETVRVEMGPPVLIAADIPTTLSGDPPIDVRLDQMPAGRSGIPKELKVTCVSMGNPHCVIFVDELSDAMVEELGPLIENHTDCFPSRTNVEFAKVVSRGKLLVRVWERGTGETRACGTGACAAAVAGVLTGRTERIVTCRLPGGELTVEWSDAGSVFLTGEAVEVFRGEWPGE